MKVNKMKEKFKILNNELILKLVIILIVIVVIIGILVIKLYNNNNMVSEVSEQERFRDEYESLNGEITLDGKNYPEVKLGFNNIKYLTIDETLSILENDTGIIYIGYAECLYCRSAIEVLMESAEEMKVESIYYLDISEIWDVKEVDKNGNIVTKVKAHDKYGELLEQLGIDEYYIEDYILIDGNKKNISTGEKRIKVPLVLFVIDGDIVSSWLGTVFSQEDPYTPLNKDQIIGIKEIYQSGIQDIKDSFENREE